MLGKLIKHEFRATARVMGLLILAELILSVLAGISSRIIEAGADSGLLNILDGLFQFAFVIAVISVTIASVVVMIQRFYKNLLGDEGYLMFTLPTGVHSLVWSKLIVSSVWFIGVGVTHALSGLIAAAAGGAFSFEMTGSWVQFSEMFPKMSTQFVLNGTAFVIEGLAVAFLGCIAACLLFYAAMATGYGFSRRKGLLSVLFFFGYQFATQLIFFGAVAAALRSSVSISVPVTEAAIMTQMHTVMLATIGAELLYCAIFYVITTLNLKKRLNLE